ncbi:hypothetical protein [Streptomyces sparsus]
MRRTTTEPGSGPDDKDPSMAHDPPMAARRAPQRGHSEAATVPGGGTDRRTA